MVASLKTRGLEEVRRLHNRLTRLYGLGRVSERDFLYLDQRCKEIEARIIEMREHGATTEGPF